MRLASLCFAIVVGLSAVVCAQDAADPASITAVDAREAFRRGQAAYATGNYNQAVSEWLNAYKADPRPLIQFNLSQAYERMGDLNRAIGALETFLKTGDPDDQTYSDASARLAMLQQRLAQTGMVVQGGGDGGQILVDDKDWGRTPRPDKIPLSPGSHTLVVRWPGRQDFRANVVVPAGQVVEVNAPAHGREGTTAAVGPTTHAAGPKQVSADTHRADKKLLFYGLGGGLAAVGVAALVYGIVRGGDVVDCDKNYCPDPEQSDTASRQSLLLGYVAGIALLGGGATLIVLGALSKDDQRSASTQCGMGFASATCRVRF